MTNTEPSSERERAKMYLFFLGCFLIVFLFLDLNLKFFLQNFGILYVEENDDEKNFPRKKNFNQKKICWKFWFQCRMFAWKNGKISNFFQTHLNHIWLTWMFFKQNETSKRKTWHFIIPFHHQRRNLLSIHLKFISFFFNDIFVFGHHHHHHHHQWHFFVHSKIVSAKNLMIMSVTTTTKRIISVTHVRRRCPKWWWWSLSWRRGISSSKKRW